MKMKECNGSRLHFGKSGGGEEAHRLHNTPPSLTYFIRIPVFGRKIGIEKNEKWKPSAERTKLHSAMDVRDIFFIFSGG